MWAESCLNSSMASLSSIVIICILESLLIVLPKSFNSSFTLMAKDFLKSEGLISLDILSPVTGI